MQVDVSEGLNDDCVKKRGLVMLNSNNRVTSRLFSKERKHATETSEIILSGITNSRFENQLELSWVNTNQLDKSYIVIACQVMLNEWNRLFKEYKIFRAFLDYSKDSTTSFYMTFEIPHPLDKAEIKGLVSSAVRLVESCLVRVSERLDENPSSVEEGMISPENYSVNEIEFDDQLEVYQGEVASNLDEQEWMIAQSSIINDKWKDESLRLQQLAQNYLRELTQEKLEKDEIIQRNQALVKKVKEMKVINRKLDQANLALIDALKKAQVEQYKVEEVTQLEAKMTEQALEVLDIKEEKAIQNQYQEKLVQENKHYQEVIDKLVAEKEKIVLEAQLNVKQLEDELTHVQKQTFVDGSEQKKVIVQQRLLRERETELKREVSDLNQKLYKVTTSFNEQSEVIDNKQEILDKLQDTVWKLEREVSEWKRKHEYTQTQLSQEKEQNEEYVVKWEHSYERMAQTVVALKKKAESYQQLLHSISQKLQELEFDIKPLNINHTPYNVEENVANEIPLTIEELTDLDDHYEPDTLKKETVMNEVIQKMTEDQSDFERSVRNLFQKSMNPSLEEVKLSEEEYALHMAEITYLPMRWNKIYQINLPNKNMEFLKWCLPYIKDLEEFWQQLGVLVKQPLFDSKVVIMDDRTLVLLQGYSKLSTYLDTYYVKPAQYTEQYLNNKGTN